MDFLVLWGSNITAAVLSEQDDPVMVFEYLFGDSAATAGGKLRAEDGHPRPYNMERMLLEVGNERVRQSLRWKDRVEEFSHSRCARRRELPSCASASCRSCWLCSLGLFDASNPIQKQIVQRAASAGC